VDIKTDENKARAPTGQARWNPALQFTPGADYRVRDALPPRIAYHSPPQMNPDITPFLMFQGKAEEAMRFYVASFPNSEIRSVSRYDDKGPGQKGLVRKAAFSLNGRPFMCIDSIVNHAFTFTSAISLFVTCQTEEEIDALFDRLSQNGHVLMPLSSYLFSERYAWVTDQFGVSWQLTLAAASDDSPS
jgi:predicted 3-demethylubiquinone-9 3-methyltransferase (glyoxalase superfamily)